MQIQMKMTGIDTDLSQAADAYLTSVEEFRNTEKVLLERKKYLIKAMKKVNRTNFTHNGFRIIFRSGHRTESSVVLKNA